MTTTLDSLKSQEAALVAEINGLLRQLSHLRDGIRQTKEANRRAGEVKRRATSAAKKEAERLNRLKGGAGYTFTEGSE